MNETAPKLAEADGIIVGSPVYYGMPNGTVLCFWILAALLSDIMCAAVAWNWCDMLWGIKYAGYSAPASIALLSAIPYAVGIAICIAFAFFFKKRSA